MPKYLFTSDLRISMLEERIKRVASLITKGGQISDILDKSDNNNATTLAFYFNLYKGTETCKIAASDPLFAIRNYILKFQFPNTRTRDSYKDSLNEKTLLAPYRVVVNVLHRMAELKENEIVYLSLSEILYFIFCNENVYSNPNYDVDELINSIIKSRNNNTHLDQLISRNLKWNQYGRQVREMMTVLTIAYPCFKLRKEHLSFSKNSPDYIKHKEKIDGILHYQYFWYPSEINNFSKSEKEYLNYMNTSESAYSIIDFSGKKQEKTIVPQEVENSSYRPFITAIKSKPFLLLAGISGTGKSRIVRELARACWDEGSEEYEAQKPRNYEMVQVKPNWHDSSELIGYVSRVSGEPIFVAGEFLKFVAKAWEEPEVPYFLCLDEMNLAPVEQYFAEYLSVVESRKSDGNGKVKTDPILKKSKEDWYRLLTDELTSSDDVRNRFLEEGICIPQNLIVVGTVNMDETTFSFSRKVLDRAMTIEMNEVDLTGGLDSKHEKIGKLGSAELIGNAVEGVDVYSAYKGVCDTAIDYLQKINEKLEGTPFKIAYRTRNEVLLYVVNNLPYQEDDDLDEGEVLKEEYIIARALDEITNMKILSRIEGDETKVSMKFLEELGKVIKDELEEISDCSFDIEETDDAYKSISLAKLEEMKNRLSSGYTSFWS